MFTKALESLRIPLKSSPMEELWILSLGTSKLFYPHDKKIKVPVHFPLQNLLQSNRMFFWWELCKLPPQHWYLIDSLSWASCNPRKQVTIPFMPFSKFIWKAVCELKFLLWLMMANIHYNRSTTLEKREKIIALCTSLWSGQFKTGEEVWLSPQTVSIYWQP